MCLILFAYKTSAQYPLILAANRDEFYQRPTKVAQFWPDQPTLFAGKDLEAGGTWLGMNIDGRFAAITNYRDGRDPATADLSRGLLPIQYLTQSQGIQQFINDLQNNGQNYNGFNLIFGHEHDLFYATNRIRSENGAYITVTRKLQPGIYGLCNHLLDTPWPKVVLGKSLLKNNLGKVSHDRLQTMLINHDRPADNELPDTHVSIALERMVSSIFISSEDYGTRSATSIIIDNLGQVSLQERNYLKGEDQKMTQETAFTAESWRARK